MIPTSYISLVPPLHLFPSLIVFIIGFPRLSFCHAGEKEDLETARNLISLINNEGDAERHRAEQQYASIPAKSKFRAVASQALALNLIQQKRFSDSWKCLTIASTEVTPSTDSLALGTDRIKLWLLLEAESEKLAGPQLERMVQLVTTQPEPLNKDLIVTIGFLGEAIGMLEAAGEMSCVPKKTLDHSKSGLEKLRSKTATTQFLESWKKGNVRASELISKVHEFKGTGGQRARDQINQMQDELKIIKQEQQSHDSLKKEKDRQKTSIGDERRKLFDRKKSIKIAMNTETPGRPVDPRFQKLPKRPEGKYEKDPKKGQRVLVSSPTLEEERTYKLAMIQQQSDIVAFPFRIQQWNQVDLARRAELDIRMNQVEQEITAKDQEIRNLQEDVHDGVGKYLKEARSNLATLEPQAEIAKFALEHLTNKPPKVKSIVRPSHFPLIDYQWESTRLSKNLKEL